MSLNRVSRLARKFQIKLAQVERGISPLDPNAPMGGMQGDPLDFEHAKSDLGAFTDVSEYSKPSKPGQPSKSQTAFSVGDQVDDRFATIKKMLDVGVPGTKGVLRLTVNDKNVKPAYNKSRWNVHPAEVKRLLTNALSPTYTVEDPIGYINPDWSVNSDPNTFTY